MFDQALTVALFIVFYCLPSLFLRARSLNSLLKQCCGPVKLQVLWYPFLFQLNPASSDALFSSYISQVKST